MRRPHFSRQLLALALLTIVAAALAAKDTIAWELPDGSPPLLQAQPSSGGESEGYLWVEPQSPMLLQQDEPRSPIPAPATPPAESSAAEEAPPVSPQPPSKPEQPPVTTEQPPERAPAPPPVPEPRYPPESALAYRSPAFRLASIPNMYGDFLGTPGAVAIVRGAEEFAPSWSYDLPPYYDDLYPTAKVELPPPGGAARMKISENNKALPSDRIYFAYSHFHNALEASASPTVTYPIDRFVLGVEKTFLNGLWSAELRMPLASDFLFSANGFQIGRQEVGNLSVIVKRLVWESERSAVAIGMGIETPTGSNLTGTSGLSSFEVSNDAVHLSPFIGFLCSPQDAYFYQGFLQVDVPTNGNSVRLGSVELGSYNDQTLLQLDISAGYWLRRNPAAFTFRGLAVVGEFHYTTTLQNSDVVAGFEPVTFDFLQVSNPMNRVDIVDFTVGLHAEIGQTRIRVGGVFPVKTNEERLFDAEVQVQVNRYF